MRHGFPPIRALLIGCLIGAVSLLVCLCVADAQQGRGQGTKKPITQLPSESKRWAVIVGVDDYGESTITSLSGAVNDARLLKETLINFAGFEEDHIILLTTKEVPQRQPKRLEVLQRLANLRGLVPTDGLFLFAFAGHGIEREGHAFLLPSDARYSDSVQLLKDSALEVELIGKYINELNARQVIMMIDACRNDPAPGRAFSGNPLTNRFSRSFDFETRNRGIEAIVKFFATAVGERSYEYNEKRHGFFTWYLAEGLKGQAANERGEVTIYSLKKYLEKKVTEAVRRELGMSQKPFTKTDGYKEDELILSVIPVDPPLAVNASPKPIPIALPTLPEQAKFRLVTSFARVKSEAPTLWFPLLETPPPPRLPVSLPVISNRRIALKTNYQPPRNPATGPAFRIEDAPPPPPSPALIVTATKAPAANDRIPARPLVIDAGEVPPTPIIRKVRPRPAAAAEDTARVPVAAINENQKRNIRPRPAESINVASSGMHPAVSAMLEKIGLSVVPFSVTEVGTTLTPWSNLRASVGKPWLTAPLVMMNYETAELDAQGKLKNRRRQENYGFVEDLGKGVKLEMVLVEGGEFLMGAADGQKDAYPNERPQHAVSVAIFAIGKNEITQAQWRAVASLPQVQIPLNPSPSRFKGDSLPVESISWYEAIEFCLRLQQLTGRIYQLPTEAEWEYACRAGTKSPFAFGNTLTTEIANYDGSSTTTLARKGTYRKTTLPIARLGVANNFGLFDMHGNAAEWCLDEWHENYEGAPANSRVWGTLESLYCVVRGGSWFDGGAKSASYHRDRFIKETKSHSIGFRISLALSQ